MSLDLSLVVPYLQKKNKTELQKIEDIQDTKTKSKIKEKEPHFYAKIFLMS